MLFLPSLDASAMLVNSSIVLTLMMFLPDPGPHVHLHAFSTYEPITPDSSKKLTKFNVSVLVTLFLRRTNPETRLSARDLCVCLFLFCFWTLIAFPGMWMAGRSQGVQWFGSLSTGNRVTEHQSVIVPCSGTGIGQDGDTWPRMGSSEPLRLLRFGWK